MQPNKPKTHQGHLDRVSSSPLVLLTQRDQWCVWKWIERPDGSWQKPPFRASDPNRHASSSDPSTWCSYEKALEVVQAGNADGISYILTPADPFTAMDLDHCRHARTHSIDIWAQNFLDTTRDTYGEVTPSGEGIRIWGLAADNAEPVNRKFTLEIDGKKIAAELFRHAPKILTVSGYRIDTIKALTNIDKAVEWALIWGERRRIAALKAAMPSNGHTFNGLGGPGHEVEEIDLMVREGAQNGDNRSNKFHAIVGHLLGCEWSIDRIDEYLREFPGGIASKYIGEGRLRGEIERSARRYQDGELPQSNGWTPPAAPAPDPGPVDDSKPEPAPAPDPDPIDDDQDPVDDDQDPVDPDPIDDEDPDPPELDDEDPPSASDPALPPSYGHGDPNPHPRNWLAKHLMTTVGHGALAGAWGSGKTFVAIDLSVAVMTGQPFCGHMIKRQSGVMWVAAEGANEVMLRLDEALRAKCGGVERAPFRWYAKTPKLLQKDAAKILIAMARRENDRLQEEFGLSLGLIVIDTVTACAGYTQAGGEQDSATGQALMDVLKEVAEATGAFVLGVRHLGKNQEAGIRGTGVTEDAADLVLVCLGDRTLSGVVTKTRLAVRKSKGGPQGTEHPYTLRLVQQPEPDEDGDPVTTMVVDWKPAADAASDTRKGPDPWAEARKQSTRTAMVRLRRAMMSTMAEHGVDQPIPPNGPSVRMIDLKIVREEFYRCTPVEGDAKQKRDKRSHQFSAAMDLADEKRLIAVAEIDDATYLYLSRPEPDAEPAKPERDDPDGDDVEEEN